MGREERIQLIKRIEEKRGSRLLIYILGDRQGLETRFAVDAFPFFLQRLTEMGSQEKIDLFLYGPGGDTMAGYALVRLIREFCDKFGVIIPFKALSCATLVALGADEIIMEKMGLLSPIDPSFTSPLGPQFSREPGQTLPVPVSAEDVTNYLRFATEEGGIGDADLRTRLIEKLSDSVHPLVIGHLHRIRQQVDFLARTLLSYHMQDPTEIKKIVETLYRGRFSHDYLISRAEAKGVVGLKIIDVGEDLDRDIMNLYTEYDRLLLLSTPFNPDAELGKNSEAERIYNRAIIESRDLTMFSEASEHSAE